MGEGVGKCVCFDEGSGSEILWSGQDSAWYAIGSLGEASTGTGACPRSPINTSMSRCPQLDLRIVHSRCRQLDFRIVHLARWVWHIFIERLILLLLPAEFNTNQPTLPSSPLFQAATRRANRSTASNGRSFERPDTCCAAMDQNPSSILQHVSAVLIHPI